MQQMNERILEPPDEEPHADWCDDCEEPLADCRHSEDDGDAAYENRRDLLLERND